MPVREKKANEGSSMLISGEGGEGTVLISSTFLFCAHRSTRTVRGTISRYRMQCRVVSWRRRTSRNEKEKTGTIPCEIGEIGRFGVRFRVPDLDLDVWPALRSACILPKTPDDGAERNDASFCFFVSN